jgi:hypothetical protein
MSVCVLTRIIKKSPCTRSPIVRNPLRQCHPRRLLYWYHCYLPLPLPLPLPLRPQPHLRPHLSSGHPLFRWQEDLANPILGLLLAIWSTGCCDG